MLLAVAAAALVVAAGGGLLFAAFHHQPATKSDAEGKKACEIADNWNQSRPGFVDAVIVDTIHTHSIHSTHTELVVRGDALADTWTHVNTQQIAGVLTPGERDLRALGPLMEFRTACVQLGYVH
jgi:hypothetical protein